MDEPPLFPQSIGIDQNVLDGPVSAPHASRVVVHYLSGAQPPQNVVDHRPVGVKIGGNAVTVLEGEMLLHD